MKKKLLVLAGPTAVGKTELSIKLAKALNGEIVSTDSMQIYKYMDIGSAKVTKEEMQGIKHHMIDIIDPSETFTVAEYKEQAKKIIDDIINRGKLPILTGGTGLYINSVTCNMNFTEADKDEGYRRELENLVEIKGKEYLHDMLQKVDPKAAEDIHYNNVKRVIRALEVYKSTGKPFSSYNLGDDMYKSDYDVRYFVLTRNREELYERINKRVDIMLERGLVDECKSLKDKGYTPSMQSMQGIGYKEILYYLNGSITLEKATEMIKQGSRNYAKRQLTWFRRDKRAIFLDRDNLTEEEIFKAIYDNIK